MQDRYGTYTYTGTVLSTPQGDTEKSAVLNYRLPVVVFFEYGFYGLLLSDSAGGYESFCRNLKNHLVWGRPLASYVKKCNN